MFDLIAFDADDTLWHTESLYTATQARLAELIAPYTDADDVAQRLYATEVRNLPYFGYGIKSFTLSMIETAIALTDGRLPSADVRQIIDMARSMIDAPTRLLDGVESVVAHLAASHTLMVLTKGDLLDQQRKLTRSGLEDYVSHVEIVSEKSAATYREILDRYEVPPERFVMIGNSLKSDVLPVVAVGGHAIHIPYTTTWAHERVEDPGDAQFVELESIAQVPAALDRLQGI